MEEVLVLLEVFESRLMESDRRFLILPIFDYDFSGNTAKRTVQGDHSQEDTRFMVRKGKPLIMCYPGWLNPESD